MDGGQVAGALTGAKTCLVSSSPGLAVPRVASRPRKPDGLNRTGSAQPGSGPANLPDPSLGHMVKVRPSASVPAGLAGSLLA